MINDRSPSEYAVAVIGDVNLDIAAQVPRDSLDTRRGDVFVPAAMTVSAAGTAVGFAVAAVERFSSVHIFGRIGDDEIGDLILSRLNRLGAHLHIARDPSRESRIVLMIREKSPWGPGTRIMIPREDVANSQLQDADLADLYDPGLKLKAVMVDGYTCLGEVSRGSVGRVLDHLSTQGVLIAFDLVPHDIYRSWSLGELLEMLKPASVLIAEAVTLMRFLGLKGEPQSEQEVRSVLPRLREAFAPRTLLLRFGIGRIDQSLAVWPNGSSRHRFTGYAESSNVAGFGDRLSVEEIVEILDRRTEV